MYENTAKIQSIEFWLNAIFYSLSNDNDKNMCFDQLGTICNDYSEEYRITGT